jgi:hypothetical protein
MRGNIPARQASRTGCHRFATIDRPRARFGQRRVHLRLLECSYTNKRRCIVQKVLVDFSFAAIVALAIGIAVGGTAFSFVWLIAVLNA